MTVVMFVAAALAGVLLVVVGAFSLLSLLWGDLLEVDEPTSEICEAG